MNLKEECEDIARFKAKLDAEDKQYPDWLSNWLIEEDGFFWDIYQRLDIQIEKNSVRVILPRGFAIWTDFLEMFDDTSVGWSIPSIGAKIVDGEPHVTIDLFLVDYHDDARHAAWLARKTNRFFRFRSRDSSFV